MQIGLIILIISILTCFLLFISCFTGNKIFNIICITLFILTSIYLTFFDDKVQYYKNDYVYICISPNK